MMGNARRSFAVDVYWPGRCGNRKGLPDTVDIHFDATVTYQRGRGRELFAN
jgi:hypothetical protein